MKVTVFIIALLFFIAGTFAAELAPKTATKPAPPMLPHVENLPVMIEASGANTGSFLKWTTRSGPISTATRRTLVLNSMTECDPSAARAGMGERRQAVGTM